jgi:ATP-dependent 26S proteasome regulatory subunit
MRDVQRTPAPILGKIEGSQQLEKVKKLIQVNRRLTFDPKLIKNQHLRYRLKAHFKCYKNMGLFYQELVKIPR